MKNWKLYFLLFILAGSLLAVFCYTHFSDNYTVVQCNLAESNYSLNECLKADESFFVDQEEKLSCLQDDCFSFLTVSYCQFLQQRCRRRNNDAQHLAKVERVIENDFEPVAAHDLFAFYQQYLAFMEVEKAQNFDFDNLSAKQGLRALAKQQKLRKKFFGQEKAETLFAAQVKLQEYQLKRRIFVFSERYSASEKEAKIARLSRNFWGADALLADNLYRRDYLYFEKLQMYKNELASFSPVRKKALLKKLRLQYYSADDVRRLEKMDALYR